MYVISASAFSLVSAFQIIHSCNTIFCFCCIINDFRAIMGNNDVIFWHFLPIPFRATVRYLQPSHLNFHLLYWHANLPYVIFLFSLSLLHLPYIWWKYSSKLNAYDLPNKETHFPFFKAVVSAITILFVTERCPRMMPSRDFRRLSYDVSI